MCVCGVVLATGEAAGVGGAGGLSLGGRTLARLSWVGVQASVCVRRRVWAGVLGGSGVEAQSGGGVVRLGAELELRRSGSSLGPSQ